MNGGRSPAERAAISRIGGLVVVNAMIFQEVLSEHDRRVPSLHDTLAHDLVIMKFCEHWKFIIEKINYYPIFHLARECLLRLTARQTDIVRYLAERAYSVVNMKVALRHDLMGRVYHRLLADRKYLATYYTGIPGATLLLKLALQPKNWGIEWHDVEKVGTFRVADLACGTGTLLMAAADAIYDNHVSASAARRKAVQAEALRRALAERIIYGYDVLASAIHLTASTLALRAPEVDFQRMNLWVLPLGGAESRLGSVEFLKEAYVTTLDLTGAGRGEQVGGKGTNEVRRDSAAELPTGLDLCVMNPPFTRSVGGNLLFGSSPEPERRQMQNKLQKLVRKHQVSASITAGLGAVFVAVADHYIRKGGRIAFVLPKALLSGVAWGKTRDILKRYHLEYVIASHDPEGGSKDNPKRWNFSENTDLSEVLLIAKKLNNNAAAEDGRRVVAVNLWRNPETTFDALTTAYQLSKDGPPDIATGQGALEIEGGHGKIGEAISLPWDEVKAWPSWMLPSAFAQSDLIRVAYHLMHGELWLPGYGTKGTIPLCVLESLGTLGPDARDIHDGFKLSRGVTQYPALWGHDAEDIFTLEQAPNRYLSPLPKAKPRRSLRKTTDLWPLAGRVLLAERLWVNTQGVVAVRVSQPVLSSVWWSFSFAGPAGNARLEKILVLWLNSTPGAISLLVNRLETRGAWMKFKKPVLHQMPVLDLKTISTDRLTSLEQAYDRLCDRALRPFPFMQEDEVRAEIDRSISKALDLPDLSPLREMLAREPVVCLRRLG